MQRFNFWISDIPPLPVFEHKSNPAFPVKQLPINPSVATDRHVIALVKPSGERFIFKFDTAGRSEALRVLGRFASNPELSFSWFDAATISERIRNC